MTPSSRLIPTLSKASMRPWASASMVRARRKAVAPKSLPSAVTNHVTGAANRAEQRRVEVAIDLGAQARHVHVDHIGLRIEVIVPDMFEQHGARDHLAGVLHEIFQQTEFARLQCDFLGPPGHLVR